MDIKAYIESGVLESVAMGTATDQEMRAAQCLSKIYPEVKTALDLAEADLEQLGRVYSKKPPINFKAKLLAEVAKHEQDPVLGLVKDEEKESKESSSNNEIPINQNAGVSNPWPQRLAWAASILAFAVAAWQFNESTEKSQKIAELESTKSELQEDFQSIEMQLAELNAGMEDMYKPELTKVLMSSVMEGVEAKVSVFWDTESGEIKLDPSNLPELPSDKQYQLWALKDGKPIDMGVLPKSATKGLLAANSTLVADAFAVTIEPLGGKPEPSLDQLIVVGYLS